MALRHSLSSPHLAERVERAVAAALDAGLRTRDLGGSAGTAEMGEALLAAL